MSISWPSIKVLALILLQSIPISSLAVPREAASSNSSASLQPLNELINGSYSITQNSNYPGLRAAGIDFKQATFLYGPPIAGGPYFPTGALGLAKVAADQALIQLDLTPELALAAVDATKATVDVLQVCYVS